MLEKDRPRRRQPHAAGRSNEERHLELVFELANLAADGRLGDAEPGGGARDAPLTGNGDEVLDLGEAHATESTSSPGAALAPATPRRISRDRNGIGRRFARRASLFGVSIEILGSREIARMREAGKAAAATLAFVAERVRAGIATAEVDRWVRAHTADLGGTPSQLGYHGFPAAVCTSRNEVVCHGIPREDELLQDGDIVNTDITTCLGGFHGDTSATIAIGEVSSEARRVVDVARRCRDAGIAVVREGARLGDVGAAIAELAKREGCSVVREFGGHGIGRRMHMDPHVSHVGVRGSGLRLRAGMVFTIEPMINLGGEAIRMLADGWTVVTADGSLSAQFEHTVLVTRDGCEILTA
jgi:methionyl aminopeptidase